MGEAWITLGRIGYVGRLKGRVNALLTEVYGDHWRIVHSVTGKALSNEAALQLYEDAYFYFWRDNSNTLEQLVRTASDVYDSAPSNVRSGTDYAKQETENTHLQDIAIRRVLQRLSRTFEGDRLVEIRGRDSEGYHLNPSNIPFHKPELILSPRQKGWWREGSVEDFWQSNKVVQIKARYAQELLRDTSGSTRETHFYTKGEKLDSLTLLWCTLGSDYPTLFAEGEKSGVRYHVIINPMYVSVLQVTSQEFYQKLIADPTQYNCILRSGYQIPKGTLQKIKSFADDVRVVSH